jgi:thioredoxin 1
MKTWAVARMLIVSCLAASGVVSASEQSAPRPETVAESYPRLAMGVLTFAKIMPLPENVLLRAGRVTVHIDQIDEIVAAQPPQIREDLRNNAYLVLAQQAAQDILLDLSRTALPAKEQQGNEQQDGQMIQDYLDAAVLSKVQVTDTDIKQLYDAEKGMLGGATLDQMYAPLKQYLLKQKKQEAVTGFIRDLGKSTDITVSDSWLKQQAVLARNNPVDKARDSGKPSLVDFGATGCGPCDMMAPILERLETRYQGKLNVLFVHVRERQVLGAKYGIQTIPVQVFFDEEGNEVFRHVGFFAQDQIEQKLAEMGVE